MFGFFKKVFGTKNERELKKLRPIVAGINEIELGLQKVGDDQLRAKTAEFKARLADKSPAEQKLILEEILPEAFAMVKNACRRLFGREIIVRGHPIKWEMIPFDVQLVGGMSLHRGKISEMATGEGKTL